MLCRRRGRERDAWRDDMLHRMASKGMATRHRWFSVTLLHMVCAKEGKAQYACRCPSPLNNNNNRII